MAVSRGLIPLQTTPVIDKNGRLTNPWYYYLRGEDNSSGVGFVYDGSAESYGPTTVFQGLASSLGSGEHGYLYFATDTGLVYQNVAGTWRAMFPALTGDVTTSVHSTVTELSPTGVTPGTYLNANVTVDAKGRITYAEDGSGGGGAGSVGGPGAVQFAGTDPGTFEGNEEIFKFEYDDTAAFRPTLTIGAPDQNDGPLIDLLGPNQSRIRAENELSLEGQVISLSTDGSVNILFDEDGAWNLAGTDPGVEYQSITSRGPGLPPVWQYAPNPMAFHCMGIA